jgi:hypothetical protein
VERVRVLAVCVLLPALSAACEAAQGGKASGTSEQRDTEVAVACEAYNVAVSAVVHGPRENLLAGYETLERAAGQIDAEDLKAALNDFVASRDSGSGQVGDVSSATAEPAPATSYPAPEARGSDAPATGSAPPLAEIDPATDGYVYLNLLCQEAGLLRPHRPSPPASEG